MLRADANPELRAFDPLIRFLHWLTLFLVATTLVLAFSVDLASSKQGAGLLIQLHRSFGSFGADSRTSPIGPPTCRS
jgi:cytochrome b561